MQNLVHLRACKILSHVQDAYSNNTIYWPLWTYFGKQQTLQCATIFHNNNKNKQFSFEIYILPKPIFLCLFKHPKLSTIFILDVKDQDECENCKEIMTLIDTILSNQEIEDYVSHFLIWNNLVFISSILRHQRHEKYFFTYILIMFSDCERDFNNL